MAGDSGKRPELDSRVQRHHHQRYHQHANHYNDAQTEVSMLSAMATDLYCCHSSVTSVGHHRPGIYTADQGSSSGYERYNDASRQRLQ